MPKVFLVNEPRKNSYGEVFDVSQAETFGEVVIIFDARNFPKPSRYPEKALAHAERVLDDIGEDDYILYAGGDAIGLAIVAMIADKFLEGFTQFLRWDKDRDSETGCYKVVSITNE